MVCEWKSSYVYWRKDFILIGAMKNAERKFLFTDKGGSQINVKILAECYAILKSDKNDNTVVPRFASFASFSDWFIVLRTFVVNGWFIVYSGLMSTSVWKNRRISIAAITARKDKVYIGLTCARSFDPDDDAYMHYFPLLNFVP